MNPDLFTPDDMPVAGWDAFWSAYPKKVGKQDALAQWLKLRPTPQLQTVMLNAIEAQKQGAQWQGGFVPDAARWLRGKRWEDEVEPVYTPTKGTIPDYGCDWCEHHPRCESPDHHAIKARMEARRDA